MKFNDGYWSLRKGVTAVYPVQVWDVETGPDSLTVYAPTNRVVQRGDTLNHAMLKLELSSPMADVIRVRITHHLGGKPASPEFALIGQPSPRWRWLPIKMPSGSPAGGFRRGFPGRGIGGSNFSRRTVCLPSAA